MDNRNRPTDDLPDFDSEGFLRNPHQWSERLARKIARHDGLAELTHSHWGVIHSLREHFDKFGAAPPSFRHVSHVNHLGRHGVDALFHSPREAWRIAGLPDPGEEARTYM
jgi:dissimilatory sulfite reductase related protein